MSPLTIVVLLFVCYCDSVSIRTVSDKKVTKDATGDFYPDWVPFKNKHGEELGEFKPVPKAKPKKRLALPVNYVLKAVVEPSGDDYYDKGAGDSDNEDYYEKKEWSDLHRNGKQVDPDKVTNVTSVDTTDIDGIVNIINSKPSPVIESILRRDKENKDDPPKPETIVKDRVESKEQDKDETDYHDKEASAENLKDEKKEKESVEEEEERENDEEAKNENSKKDDQKEKEIDNKEESEEETAEDTEEPKKKQPKLSEEEQRENEEKKAKILSSVDDLKARHAQEQRIISERVKEEELFREERERDKGRNPKYSKEIYDEKPKWKKPDYDEYEEDLSSAEDKYKIIPEKTTTTTVRPIRRNPKRRKNKSVATGKLSVFKNPQLYVVYDDDSAETTTRKPETMKKPKKQDKFSSRYSVSKAKEEENIRISLVPEDNSKSDEPTLFYPKKRKNRRRFKTTTEPTDSYIAESVSDDKKTDLTAATALAYDLTGPEKTETTASDITAPSTVDVTFSASNTAPSASGSAPSGPGTAPSAPDAVKSASDSHHASTKKKEKKPENYEFERGGARDHHAETDDEHIEHGKKAYEGVHKERKTVKGHHDKEDHLGKYDDHGGVDKEHHDESGHYGSHHHEEHGKKHAKYEESGKHSKGHSTKGSHDIHKKEEYEKRVEFFEEEGDSDELENHGGHHSEKAHQKGGHFKNGKLQASHEGHDKGDFGHFAKGGHGHKHQGHRAAAGHDQHGKRGHGHHTGEGKESGKKWVYHHGHPAKTANLVVIDRRADKYYHGPQYYG